MVFVAFVDKLVRAGDELEVVDVVELRVWQVSTFISTIEWDGHDAYLARNFITE